MGMITLGDGRRLAYEVYGDPSGEPVLFQHGTGHSRLDRFPDESVTSALGVRPVTVDRPGVGGSAPRAG
jgi:pimeloyl-ACP methyl ester carboxylesterase